MYMANGVLRVKQIQFLPSVCADRGPVAETDVGTVGKGRGGTSLFIFRLDFPESTLPVGFDEVASSFPFAREFSALSLADVDSDATGIVTSIAWSLRAESRAFSRLSCRPGVSLSESRFRFLLLIGCEESMTLGKSN
jgi:hypothetical protein